MYTQISSVSSAPSRKLQSAVKLVASWLYLQFRRRQRKPFAQFRHGRALSGKKNAAHVSGPSCTGTGCGASPGVTEPATGPAAGAAAVAGAPPLPPAPAPEPTDGGASAARRAAARALPLLQGLAGRAGDAARCWLAPGSRRGGLRGPWRGCRRRPRLRLWRPLPLGSPPGTSCTNSSSSPLSDASSAESCVAGCACCAGTNAFTHEEIHPMLAQKAAECVNTGGDGTALHSSAQLRRARCGRSRSRAPTHQPPGEM